MWFWFSVIALLFWSGSDLFSKIGCRDADDKYAHLKMVMAVGVVMGLHAAYEIFIGGTEINFSIILTYLPVSLLYIVSMALGYVGLRYIELSISSPICNSSGAMVAILSIITGSALLAPAQYAAMALVCVGVIGLGIVEAREDEELRLLRQEAGNYKYAKSALALVLPILYCVLDALGTFADSKVLETLNEDSANCAYELTFLAAGIVCFVYGDGSYTVSWTNDTGSTVKWDDAQSALTVTMQYTGYCSVAPGADEEHPYAGACTIESITIE